MSPVRTLADKPDAGSGGGRPPLDPPPSRLNGTGHGRRRASAEEDGRRLAALASRGDVEAFTKLVDEHSGLVHEVAVRILGAGDARDAAQEVWIKVWGSMKSFKGDSAFSTWLYRVAVNTCLNARRKRARREGWECGDEGDPEAVSLSRELRDEVRGALGRVRSKHRAALVLRHMRGLSYAEIAEALDVPDGTVKSWISRLRVRRGAPSQVSNLLYN